jgi:hypothetical protein
MAGPVNSVNTSGSGVGLHWKEPVANPAALLLTGNTAGDRRTVLDDGDGRPADYEWTGVLWLKMADPDGGGGPTYVHLASDVETSSNPTGLGSGLKFTPDTANATYRVEVFARTISDNAAVGLAWSWAGDTGDAFFQSRWSSRSQTTAPEHRHNDDATTWVTAIQALAAPNLVHIIAMLRSDASPGEIELMFRPELNGTSVYIQQYSWLSWVKVSA